MEPIKKITKNGHFRYTLKNTDVYSWDLFDVIAVVLLLLSK